MQHGHHRLLFAGEAALGFARDRDNPANSTATLRLSGIPAFMGIGRTS
jgi:hypothetical protein